MEHYYESSDEEIELSDIEEFFTKEELNKMSIYEKKKYIRMTKNYMDMIDEGFHVPEPTFMKKKIKKVDKSIKVLSDSEDDNQLLKETPSKKMKMQLRNNSRVSVGDRPGTSGVSEPPRRYPKRNVAKKNYEEEEIIADDRYIYCDDCMEEWVDYCKVHGDLIIIKDLEAAKDPDDPERAKKTTPKDWMAVKPSKISGVGVWSVRHIPEAVRFGPYEGEISDEANDEGYCWELRVNGRHKKCIDAFNPGLSNWMRYVNCARNKSEQNLMAFQYCGKMYYRTLYEIKPHTELLVWYGTKFAKELGIDCKKYNAPLEKPLNDNVFQCIDCHITFGNPMHLEEHVKRCNMKEKIENILKINKNIAEVSGSCYKCAYCHLGFSTSEYREKHVMRCTKRVYDDVVNNTDSNQPLKILKTAIKEKFIKCDKCEKTFASKIGLYQHKQFHTGRGLKSCDVCEKKFVNTSALLLHMRTHTKEKPYMCSVCDKKFTKSSHLTYHMRTHTGERPYMCSVCDKKFTCSHHLTYHMRTHTGERPYMCSVCDKKFTCSHHLTYHMRTHTGERPYMCSVCDKKFTQSCNLTSHMRTHTEERPYMCSVCDKKCTTSCNLTSHMRTHKGNKSI